jgi:hypothetical protein
MPLGPLEDGVQPTVAAHPSQGALDDPPNPFRNEGSAVPTGAELDGDAKRLAGLGQPLAPIAEITQGRSVKTKRKSASWSMDALTCILQLK